MEIGRVVGSRDHADYQVQIYGPGEMPVPPTALDRALGQFVSIPVDEIERLIGVIYSTQLVNPEFGTLGPRLSTTQELPVFTPDYLAETATLVGVTILGSARQQGGKTVYDQRTPPLAAAIDAPVLLLAPDEFLAFHQGESGLSLAYFPRLLARPFPALPDLLCSIVDRLIAAFPSDRARLMVVRQNILWNAIVEAH
jgi:hypothetical protein